MRNIPPVSEDLYSRCPFLSSGGAGNDLILVLLYNGLADFKDDEADGVPCPAEAINEAKLLVT